MLKALFETGHPWITFKDPSNIRYSNQHVGTVHSSNLCTEILLHTKPTTFKDNNLREVEEYGETAVCNLASINLKNHLKVNINYQSIIGEIEMEKITFCIPSKNNRRYLEACIPSIRKNASRDDHDIIVFVDADNDGTVEWLKSVELKYNLKYIQDKDLNLN